MAYKKNCIKSNLYDGRFKKGRGDQKRKAYDESCKENIQNGYKKESDGRSRLFGIRFTNI